MGERRTAATCSLTLRIGPVEYRLSPVSRPSGRAWRLRRVDGKGTCVVAETMTGATCTCEDQTFRHSGPGDRGCKHVRAARALGLIC
jgi:hypothetical protein